MKTTDERVKDVMSRARLLEAAQRRRRQRGVAIGGGALSIAIVAVVGLGFSSVVGAGSPHAGDSLGLMGSVLSGGSALGYVVVGLLGLVLGVAVTVLAFKVGRKPPLGNMHEAQEEEAPERVAGDGEGQEP